jgi:hypothetical protein
LIQVKRSGAAAMVSPASAVGSVRTPPKSSYEPEIAGHAATFRKALASDEVKAMKGCPEALGQKSPGQLSLE